MFYKVGYAKRVEYLRQFEKYKCIFYETARSNRLVVFMIIFDV